MAAPCKRPTQGVSEKELILLGLIAEGPIHAYGLEEKIKTRHMTEWTEISFSSVYRVLARLEEQQLIDSRLEHGGQGATRKVLAINDAGLAALAAGVSEQLAVMQPVKNPFAVGLAFLTRAPQAEAIRRLEQRLIELRHVQDQLQGIGCVLSGERSDSPAAPSGDEWRRHQLCAQLLFDHLLRHLHAEEEFLLDTLRLLPSIEPHLFSSVELTEAPAVEAAAGADTEVER